MAQSLDLNAHLPWYTGTKDNRVIKNGVRAPLSHSKCGQAWLHFDNCYRMAVVPDRRTIFRTGVELGLNEGNLRTEIGYYRRFHDIT